MSSKGGITVDKGSINTIIQNINKFEKKHRAALLIVAEKVAVSMEEWAKTNAKWTDRTGNARQFLRGTAEWDTLYSLTVVMCHTMDYGVWLELAHERKYAILEDAILEHKDDLIKGWNSIMGALK